MGIQVLARKFRPKTTSSEEYVIYPYFLVVYLSIELSSPGLATSPQGRGLQKGGYCDGHGWLFSQFPAVHRHSTVFSVTQDPLVHPVTVFAIAIIVTAAIIVITTIVVANAITVSIAVTVT
jgi:hypothetical protein